MGRAGQAEPTPPTAGGFSGDEPWDEGCQRTSLARREGGPGRPSLTEGCKRRSGKGQTLTSGTKNKDLFRAPSPTASLPRAPCVRKGTALSRARAGTTGSATGTQEASSQPRFRLPAGVPRGRPLATNAFTRPLATDGVRAQRNPTERVKHPEDALPLRLPPGEASLTTGKH